MKTPIQQRVGKLIKEYRKKAGLTQDQLAEQTGIDYKYIQKIEGKNPPLIRVDTVEKIAKTLKISPSKLLD